MVKVGKEKIDELLAVFLNRNNPETFEIIGGEGKVMVSAPHSVEQTREGRIKYGEYQTGVISKLLHEYTHCPVIYKLRNDNDDANYDENSEYRTTLIQHVTDNKLLYLIDLHQMAPFRDEMIDIGTGRGNNIYSRDDIVAGIIDAFKRRKIPNITVDYPFDAVYGHTVSAAISRECLIPAFQIEINSKLLYPEHSEYNFDGILNAMIDIVEFLNNG